MAKKTSGGSSDRGPSHTSASVDELLLAALERGDESLETGRILITYRENAVEEGVVSLGALGMRVADSRDFEGQALGLESVNDADAVVLPEIGVALVSGNAALERGLSAFTELAADSPVESIDPEYFMFAERATLELPGEVAEYLRGFACAADAIARNLHVVDVPEMEEEEALAIAATWGLIACKVPPTIRSGANIRVAVLDTGMDLGHPDFAGRPIVSQSFVNEPVQDLNGHGTHCIGTACGTRSPAGSTPRYGIAHRAPIFAGKVLTNAGAGTQAGVLAGMNWAIANRCQVISMSLGAPIGVQPSYTAAGNAALANGCLIIAAAGNVGGGFTGAPANSSSIMAVGSLDPNLAPSSFSSYGKIEIAAPGRDVFSSWPRPTRYRTISGTSMATPHVAGCAALWAESSATLRGAALWKKLQASARRLPFPATRIGAGLVQAP